MKNNILTIILLIVLIILLIFYFLNADRTPPVISEIQVSNITEDSATIRWITNEDSDSVINYGFATSSYEFVASGVTTATGTNVFSHYVELTNLSSSTEYHYKVSSTDNSGNRAESEDKVFTTLQPPQPLPNLTLFGFSNPLEVEVGESVILKTRIRNTGTVTAPTSTLLVALSRTPTFQDIFPEAQDILSVPPIHPHNQDDSNTVWISWSTVIPETTDNFIYFMAKCDPADLILESGENDNGGGIEMIISNP